MKDGWHNNDYLILLETEQATERYGLRERLPGYIIVGLRGWDDFIIADANLKYYTVPTVPATTNEIRPYDFPSDSPGLESDARYAGKVKWYITPLIFGGSPSDPQNIAWIALDQHAEAVRWWNSKYDEIKKQGA